MALVISVAQVLAGVTVSAQPSQRSGPPPPPKVTVRRTVPRVSTPTSAPVFSAQPTVHEIRQARVFVEPLLPVGPEPSPEENAALARVITAYRARNEVDAIGMFRLFLEQYRTTSWRASLEANLAQVLWAQGEFTSALAHWDDAWQISKDVDTPEGRAVAGIAMAGALEVLATLGMADQLEARLRVIEGRPLEGAAAATARMARQTATQLREAPDLVIPSGSQALEVIAAYVAKREPTFIMPRKDGGKGETLDAVEQVSRGVGLPFTAVQRPFGELLPVPSIVHLKLGHYSPILEHRAGKYLIVDPALGGQRWISQATLDEQASGFVLVPERLKPAAWRRPTDVESKVTIGHSCTAGGPGEGPCPESGVGSGGSGSGAGGGGGSTGDSAPAPTCGGGGSCGMPRVSLKPENAGLALVDTPVGYTPPKGPSIPFTFTYDHRQQSQPQTFTFTHMGPRWSLNWTSYAQEVPFWVNPGWNNESIPAHVTVRLRETGTETFHSPDAAGVYPAHWRSRAQLVRVSSNPIRYERRLPDGRLEVFALADTAPAGQRRVFLTEVRDAHGNAVSLAYDAQYRLIAVTDAVGQVSVLYYESPTDPLRLTRIEDPFGRTATLTFNGAGQLESITDVGGLRSSFAYGVADFIASMTTPYGTTTFTHEGTDAANHPYVQATDPLGGVRRVEYHFSTSAVPATVPTSEVPTGFSAWNDSLNYYVTLIWDSRGWAASPGSPATATAVRWFLNGWSGSYSKLVTTRVPQYVQRPGEARLWYAYPGQNQQLPQLMTGWSTTPSVTARVLDDGATQQWRASVNAAGSITERIDPLGRRTNYDYAANGVDLLTVRQTTGATNDFVASYANYTLGHQPQSITDAAGQTTTLTYNPTGQVLTVTNPLSETTTYAYAADGHLS